jgi:sulfur carrier protein
VNAVVNGAPREVAEGSTVAHLLRDLGVEAPVGIAVAVNASVVRRGAFEEHLLHEGDEIEIIRAVSGG